MNKKIITLAVGAVMGAAPMVGAQADVKVYGQAQAQVYRADNGPNTVTLQNDNGGRGRLGFLFNEKLGNGLTSFGKMEFQVDINDSYSAGCKSVTKTSGGTGIVGEQTCMRDAFVGIKGGFGSIAGGSFHGAYKTAGGVKYDPFVTTALQARGNGGMASGRMASNNFVRQIVQYETPNLAGFKVQYQYSFDQSNPGTPNSGTTNGDWLGAVKYKMGPFEAIAAYAHDRQQSGPNSANNNWKVGGRFHTGPFMVTAQYERVETGATVNFNGISNTAGTKAKVWYLNGGYKLGNWDLIAAYGKYDSDNNALDTKYWVGGAWYHFSKKTSVFGGYRASLVDTPNKDQKVWATGLRIDF